MKWGLWNTTASSNSATPPDGWPEGQLPSTVNDCAREMMAQIKTGIQNIQFIDLGLTPTQTGNTTFTLAGNQMAYFEYGRRVQAQVGSSTYYGTIISASFTTNTGVTLRFDMSSGPGAALTNSLSAVATGFPSQLNNAIPDQVWKKEAINLNGCFDIWQIGNSISCSAVQVTKLADMWKWVASASAGLAVTCQRYERSLSASNVPTVAQCGQLLNSSMGFLVSAGMASVATGQYAGFDTRIEGYDFRSIAQKPMTLSFWVKTNVSGIYCVSMLNAGQNQACVMPYTISTTGVWTPVTLTFPKSPSAGTWDYSSGIGLQVYFTLAAGSTYQAGGGNWTATLALATSAQVNFLTTANNLFRIAGVKLNEGTVAVPLERRDIAADLMKAKRYYEPQTTQQVTGGGYGLATNVFQFAFPFACPKRISPTVITPSGVNETNISALTMSANINGFLATVAIAATGAYTYNLVVIADATL